MLITIITYASNFHIDMFAKELLGISKEDTDKLCESKKIVRTGWPYGIYWMTHLFHYKAYGQKEKLNFVSSQSCSRKTT